MATARPEPGTGQRPVGLYAFVATASLLLLAVAGTIVWLIATEPPPKPQVALPAVELKLDPPPAVAAPSVEQAPPAAATTAQQRPAEPVPAIPPQPTQPTQPTQPRPQAAAVTLPLASPGPLAVPTLTPGPQQAAWMKHARPFQAKPDRPRVALILHGLGMDRAQTQAAIQQLPPEITLAFSPYASGLQAWVEEARAAGHEVLVQVPMEPHDYPANDPGPLALITGATTRENIERLDMVLGRANGALGVINLMGARFTASEPHMRPILEALRERGLVFVDARTAPDSVGARLASELGVARAFSDRTLDQEASRAAIDARLAEIERMALANGQALALGFPFPVTLERTARWVQTLEAKSLQLAPLSAVVNRQRIGS